jgi:hypothetical protein
MRIWGLHQAVEDEHPEYRWEPSGCLGLLLGVLAITTLVAWVLAR